MYPRRAAVFSTMLLFAGMAHAQNSDATIQALLVEVKQLRLALERSAVLAPKMQVALQRIQLQPEQVSRLSRQLEDLHDRMAKTASDRARMAAHLKQAEVQLAQEQDPTRRKALESEVRDGNSFLEAGQPAVQEATKKARESELTGRLRTEQARLDELNDRLNALEQLLDRTPSKP